MLAGWYSVTRSHQRALHTDGLFLHPDQLRYVRHRHSVVQGTKVAATAVALQRALPAARVIYCSATGVSEVGNM